MRADIHGTQQALPLSKLEDLVRLTHFAWSLISALLICK